MTCERCRNMDEYIRFRTPRELFKVVGVVRQAVADGDIEEIDAGPMKGVVSFGDLRETGPWDDLLIYRFMCPGCHENYVLGAETYHGSGGSWGKAPPLNPG